MSMNSVHTGISRSWEIAKAALQSLPGKARHSWAKLTKTIGYMRDALKAHVENTHIYKMLSQRLCDHACPELRILQGVTEEFSKLYQRLTETSGQLEQARARLQELEESLKTIKDEKLDIAAKSKELAADLRDMEFDKNDLAAKLKTEQEKTAAQQHVSSEQQEQITQLKQQLDALVAKQHRMQTAITNAQNDLQQAD